MNETTLKSSPAKRGGWLRKLLLIAGLLVVLLVIAFFVLTSGAFVKAMVLPRVGTAINADLEVGDVQLSPFSQLVLRDVKLTPKGAEPLLTASLVRARYSLLAILRGNILVEEVTVESPNFTLLENADGKSNLDPLLEGLQAGTNAAPATPAKSSAPPKVDIRVVSLKNASVRRTKNLKSGGHESLEVTGLNLTASNLKNGATGKLEWTAALALDNTAPGNVGSLSAKLNGDFTFDLSADLKPSRANGKASFKLEKTAGNFTDFSALAAALDCEVTPTEVKQLALRFTQAGQPLGELRVSGPFDAPKTEGRLNVAVLSLDRRVLNLAGAASGIDFGTTVVNSTNLIELTQGGMTITASGQFDATGVRITRQGQTTPTLDLRCGYDATVDRTAQTALLKTLNLTGMQNSRLLLTAGLSSPMTIPFGPGAKSAAPDAALSLSLTDLNLADWRAFAAELEPAGVAGAKLKLLSQEGGQSLTFDLEANATGLSAKLGTNNTLTKADLKLTARGTSQQGGTNVTFDLDASVTGLAAKLDANTINPTDLKLRARGQSQQNGKNLTFDLDAGATGFSAKLGTNMINPTDLTLRARGAGTDLKQFKLEEFRADVAQAGQAAQPAATVSGSGTFDTATQDADLQVELRATLTRLLAMFPQPGANFAGGSLAWIGRVASKAKSQSVTGKLTLDGLTGKYADFRFASFGSSADLDLGMKGSQLEIRRANGELHEGANAGGKFEVAGNLDTERKAGQLTLKLDGFNASGLRPFLESALGDKKLVSVAINSIATVKLEANGDTAAKADLQITNLVVNDPTGSLPTTPLEAKAVVDASVAQSVAQVRQFEVTLTPTERASNKLNLTGAVDFSKTNAISGNLKLASDSLDVTRYYDLFAGDSKAVAKPAPQSPAPSDNKEPEAMKLPFSNFSLEATVGKSYLREVEATNVHFVVKLDGSRVLVKPAQLTLNGAPVNATADLDLSVDGYKYDVTLGAQPIPLAPFVNSFVPERKGQLAGVTLANANIKGAGITGASLRKNLSGDFGFASTNLNLAIPNLQSKLIKEVINVIVGIPDLIKNPTAALGNLLGRLTGSGSSTKGGFTEDLMSRPIDAIQVRGRALNGKITLEQAEVRSSAFQASAAGDITLADILTNSAIRFPVRVSLSRPFAEKVGLAGNTPTNQLMVALPDFLTMKGSLGKPEKDINALALIAVAAKAGGGVAGQIGGATGDKVGGVLNLISGLAGGNPQPTTTGTAPTAAPQPQPQTSPAPTTAPRTQPQTNAPSTSTMRPTAAGAKSAAPSAPVPATNPPAQQQKQVNVLDLFRPQPAPTNTNAAKTNTVSINAGTNTAKATTNAPTSNTQTQQQINLLDLFKKPKKQ